MFLGATLLAAVRSVCFAIDLLTAVKKLQLLTGVHHESSGQMMREVKISTDKQK